ncbi:ribonuclease H-like domain-containing protein [Asaccharospora irregularis]|uniref:ATP-dependent DNA helicase DinG n=1 Tax=Asaccharospora irregularis DSM 2635 TaxID=1121321 RepID=A0A1M5NSQ7_9FIRM|nr:ribonuclease H-like domain-containing protein [Asaccharospora irregularis]SHG92498.1 ATP-dependent DNA helicase DinG [Asaccharospora irregularis DSM 2635]
MDCPVYVKKEDNMFSILDNIVFLDIEASELDPKKSEIIGVGAVKVDEGSIELFESTGSLQDISFHFKNFLGNKTIIVHNADLVMRFLKYNMPEIKNKILDSMELVVILEPYHTG